MKATWGQDTYLLSVDVDDARRVIDLVERHGRIPSLPEMKQLFSQLFNQNRKVEFAACDICNGDGWDSGLRLGYDDNGNSVVTQERYTETENGITYNVVRRCACRS